VNTILVIDDDVAMRRDVCEALEGAGYATVAASNGRDAIEALSSYGRPRAIVLDLDMPDMDGVAFKRWLNQQPALKTIPVIVASAYVRQRALDVLRPAAVLLKPFSPEALLDCVEATAS
jgi:CheY-like chemotaxis protein